MNVLDHLPGYGGAFTGWKAGAGAAILSTIPVDNSVGHHRSAAEKSGMIGEQTAAPPGGEVLSTDSVDSTVDRPVGAGTGQADSLWHDCPELFPSGQHGLSRSCPEGRPGPRSFPPNLWISMWMQWAASLQSLAVPGVAECCPAFEQKHKPLF
jgi:hypothetical protein